MRKAKSHWQDVVLVCRKCSKKADGGFGRGGRKSLAKALLKALALKKGRRAAVGVVEVDCMKLCPKAAVTTVVASRPGVMHAVPVGASMGELVGQLGLARFRPNSPANDPDPPPRNEPLKSPADTPDRG
ncbi:MAG: (2Fe-2S) ferredoxin domain-containing protein [Hyphomonadaceae bacterium]